MKKKKVKENVNHVSFPMYSYTVAIIVTTDIVKSRSKRNEVLGYAETDLTGVLGLHCFDDSTFTGYIFLNPDSEQSTITHECFHAVHSIARVIGARLDDASEEFYAYHLGYLTGIVTKQVKRAKKQTK